MVFEGIVFFSDPVFEAPLVFTGIALSLLGGIWYAMDQSDLGGKTEDEALGVSSDPWSQSSELGLSAIDSEEMVVKGSTWRIYRFSQFTLVTVHFETHFFCLWKLLLLQLHVSFGAKKALDRDALDARWLWEWNTGPRSTRLCSVLCSFWLFACLDVQSEKIICYVIDNSV